MRFLLRVLGYALLLAAFAAFVVDGTRSVAARALMTFPLLDTARWLLPGATADLAAWLAGAPPALAWAAGEILAAPTSLVSGGLATLCFLAQGRREVEPSS